MVLDIFRLGVDLFSQANEARWNPFSLEGNLLLFFRDLKKSIDSKDIQKLQKLISDEYYSRSFINTNKHQLLSYFRSSFEAMPFFVHPSLEVDICRLPEVKDQRVSLVFKPILNVQTLEITLMSKPFGTQERIALLLERDTKSGLFSIINMEDIY